MNIPGAGWDTESVVTGCIKIRRHDLMDESRQIIHAFEYDVLFPFTNIFWGGSPADYGFPIIGFAGSYKQIEEAWLEWMWKFSRLLSGLDAVEAQVSLSCVLGNYLWVLQPRLHFTDLSASFSASMKGQTWGITGAATPDFSVDPIWCSHCTEGLHNGFMDWPELERWNKPQDKDEEML